MSDLKTAPCPFCGSATECSPTPVYSRSKLSPGPTYYVLCSVCGASGPTGDIVEGGSFFAEEEAIRAWNKRGEAHRKAVEAVEKITAAVVDSFLFNSGITQDEAP